MLKLHFLTGRRYNGCGNQCGLETLFQRLEPLPLALPWTLSALDICKTSGILHGICAERARLKLADGPVREEQRIVEMSL